MYDLSLISICMMAFTGVFALLGLLAFVMKIIIAAFPPTEAELKKKKKAPVRSVPAAAPAGVPAPETGSIDSGLIAALTTVMAAAHPGAKISNIEEIK